MYGDSSVQLILSFHMPKNDERTLWSQGIQNIIYANSSEQYDAQKHAVKAILRMISRQSQCLELGNEMISFFGHEENFYQKSRLVSWGNTRWPFRFLRAMVRWEAHAWNEEADIMVEVDFYLDINRDHRIEWRKNGKIRLPKTINYRFQYQMVINDEELPELTVIDSATDEPTYISSEDEYIQESDRKRRRRK